MGVLDMVAQLGQVWGVFSNANDSYFFLKIFPSKISLHYKPGHVGIWSIVSIVHVHLLSYREHKLTIRVG